VALVVPGAILFNRYPFVAVMIWLLVFPFFAREPSAAGRYIYWILHRAMIPTALGIAILSDWLRVKKREPVRLGRAELAMVIFLGLALVKEIVEAHGGQVTAQSDVGKGSTFRVRLPGLTGSRRRGDDDKVGSS